MIGVVTTSYPRHPGDPSGSFVHERVCRLHETGGAVDVVSRAFSISNLGGPESLELGGVAAWVLAAGCFADLLREVASRSPHWRRAESHWLVPGGLAVALRAPSLHHRAFAHGGDVALLERIPFGASLGRWLAGRATEIVFASRDLRDRFVVLCGWHECPAHFLAEPAPFDRSLFQQTTSLERDEARRRHGLDRPTIFAAGRLVPIKGFDVLIRAVSRLPSRPQLVIAGDGPERNALTKLADARRLSVRFLGTVSRAEVAGWMAAADLFVQPSRALSNGRTEGAPVAAREALARGLPVVVTHTGGLVELAENAQVTFVAPDDPAALAFALSATLSKISSANAASHLGAAKCESGVSIPRASER